MGLLDAIFRKPRALPLEGLAALRDGSAGLTATGYTFAGKAGLCLKKGAPTSLELTGLLAGAALPARYELATDEYGCTWIIARGDLGSSVDAMATIGRLLNGAKRGGDVLCVAFAFEKDGHRTYLIYNRQGVFYPFAPQDGEHDVMRELKLKDLLSASLPVEASESRWFPLWGMPF